MNRLATVWLVALVMGFLMAWPQWLRAQDPCAELPKLREDARQKWDVVSQSTEDLAKAGAVQLGQRPPGDRERFINALRTIEKLRVATKQLSTFDQSFEGKRLSQDLPNEMNLAKQAVSNSSAAEQNARQKNPDLSRQYNDTCKKLKETKAQLKLVEEAKAADRIINANKREVERLTALEAAQRNELFDADTQLKMKSRAADEKTLDSLQKELDSLQALRDKAEKPVTQAKQELKQYSDLGNEAEIKTKLAAIDQYEEAAGKLQGDIHQKKLKLDADRAAALAAQDIYDKLLEETTSQAEEEARIAREDAYLNNVDSGLAVKRDELIERIKNNVKPRMLKEQKADPKLWETDEAKAERMTHWNRIYREEVAEGYRQLVEAEALRLEGVITQHLHLFCMDKVREARDLIQEKANFLRNPQGTAVGGIENPIGFIPPIELAEVPFDNPTAERTAGMFKLVKKEVGKAASPGGNNDSKVWGEIGENSYSFHQEMIKPYEGRADITAKWSTPPESLKPGDEIELASSIKADITGKDIPYVGMSAGWDCEGSLTWLEGKSAYAGYASDGKLYPSAETKIRYKVGEGGRIVITSIHNGCAWGNDGKWNPCIYTYEWQAGK